MLAIGINKKHYTAEGIRENKAFSVNFPKADMVEKVDYCGLVSGRNEDKSGVFELFYGQLRSAPMIKDCPLCIECRLKDTVELPTNDLFIGEIAGAYTEDRYLTDEKLDPRKIDPLMLTMPDNSYWTLGEKAGKAWSDGKRLIG
jgi:flavin reductase (DIM6/NTAB) family NADH-FMN oxidoreductase RutF